jgi:plastocyanin
MRITAVKFVVFAGALLFAGAVQSQAQTVKNVTAKKDTPGPVQIVALDECDPTTFNRPPAPDGDPNKGGVGPDFCKNVALGAQTNFASLFDEAIKGHPDPNWDFEPDEVTVRKGAQIVVLNSGGEPHTFTEVKQFGGGFIDPLNSGQPEATECHGGFANLAVARTRILQGSQFQVNGLSKGEHKFQCCIHPWMRVTVDVKDDNDDHGHDR